MKVPMGPPPPKTSNPNPSPESATAVQILEENARMDAPNETLTEETTPNPNPNANSTSSGPTQSSITIPYSIPPWSEPPGQPFLLEVLKDGSIIEQIDVSEKGAYMFGRIDLCDFVLEHPTISRFHAVLQFKKDGEALLYDIGSTHGTFINKHEVRKKEYTKVNVGDVIRFGHSSRLYIFQGPSELMPPEGDLEKVRSSKALREEMLDREASLARARAEASLADGISWGMDEDAIEESSENGADEITWQTFKGQLTERQEKTRGKIIKRMEKVANMKKEIDAIRAKDIAQGGLTQGQQTQIARNEQRMSQIMEELESLEETLNESIQESIGARTGKVVRNRKMGILMEEEDILSDDDDDFYDRTKKKSSTKKSGEQKSVETADTLLDKKESIIKEMEEKATLLLKEKEKLPSSKESNSEYGDDLDAYMTGLSSQLVIDKAGQIEKELLNLQSELDRIVYLLKLADPLGDAARKREAKAKMPKPTQPVLDVRNQPEPKQKEPLKKETPNSAQAEKSTSPGEAKDASENKEKETPVYTATKPQWLGDTKSMKVEDTHAQEAVVDATESDCFVDYKDRKKVLPSVNNEEAELEKAAPGLIIRKRKPVEELGETSDKAPKVDGPTSSVAETTAVDAVALLLKHKRGYSALDDEINDESKETCKTKRILGPSKPDFLERSPDYETWVPPEGQTGDGRTSLNDRLGY